MAGGENDLSDYIDKVSDLPSSDADTSTFELDKGGQDAGADTSVDGTPVEKTGKAKDETVKEPKQPADKQQTQPKAKDEQSGKDDKGARPKLSKTPNGNIVDDKGNIVDEQGQILAPIGKARRIFEDNQRLTRDITRVTEERNRFELQTREVQLLNGEATRQQLNHDEVAQALDMAGRMKRGDVLGVARDVIALISARGHNISELLGQDVGDSIDMKAMRALLDERLGPVQQREQQEQQQQQQRENGRRDYERFVSDNEYADVHGDAIVNLSRSNKISVQMAYNRLREFADVNGFDFTAPLGPQIAERQQSGQQQQQQQQRDPDARPLANKGARTRDNGVRDAQSVQMADPDEDWASIIRRAM